MVTPTRYITIYSYDCEVGKHHLEKSKSVPIRCFKCNAVTCEDHRKKYWICSNCWSNITPREFAEAKKYYFKVFGKASSFLCLLFCIFFGVGALAVYFRDNDTLFYSILIGGLLLITIGLLKWISYKRIKTHGESAGLWAELKREFKNAPPMDKKSKKILKIVCLIFTLLILMVTIVAVVLMDQFNAKYS